VIAKTLARTDAVVVEAFWHTPGEGAAAIERWPATSLAFTAAGAWCLRGRGGMTAGIKSASVEDKS
jgi:hypothetical protein